MVWLMRIILLALLVFFFYIILNLAWNPNRKIEAARKQKRYLMLDEPGSVKKNFLITYKGALFEGVKYLGTTGHSFKVVSIYLWPHGIPSLNGMVKEDFLFLEKKISEQYPSATIMWKSPVNELFNEK